MCKEVSDWDPRQLGAHPRAGGAAPESQERSRASGREGRSVVPSARGWQRPSAAGPASSRSTNRLQDAALRTHRLSRRQPSSPTHRGSRSPRGFQTLAPKPRSHKSRGDVMTPHAARAPPGSQAVRAAALGLRAAGPGGAAQQSPWNWTGRRLLREPSEGRPVSTPRLPPLLASPVGGLARPVVSDRPLFRPEVANLGHPGWPLVEEDPFPAAAPCGVDGRTVRPEDFSSSPVMLLGSRFKTFEPVPLPKKWGTYGNPSCDVSCCPLQAALCPLYS